jgi:protein-tyrosine phosphatase
MEYYLDSRFPDHLSELQPLGESRLLLVEAPAWAGVDMILENIRQIVASGFVPLFAHPERCKLIAAPGQGGGLWARACTLFGRGEPEPSMDLLSQLQDFGCLFQGNLGSFAGRYGQLVEKRAVALLDAGLYSCLGSDSHPLPGLEEMISGGLEKVRCLTSNYRQLLSADQILS